MGERAGLERKSIKSLTERKQNREDIWEERHGRENEKACVCTCVNLN